MLSGQDSFIHRELYHLRLLILRQTQGVVTSSLSDALSSVYTELGGWLVHSRCLAPSRSNPDQYTIHHVNLCDQLHFLNSYLHATAGALLLHIVCIQ